MGSRIENALARFEEAVEQAGKAYELALQEYTARPTISVKALRQYVKDQINV